MPLDGYLSADDPVLSLGLTKEQLLQCAYRPMWRWLRGTLLTAYWLAWFAMLGAAVAIIIHAPKCDSLPPLQWWQRSPMYHVLVPSFSDSGHPPHGLGDIAGLESRLDYIEQLGVRTVCLSPIFNSSVEDPESIVNFTTIAPHFGTMDDFISLIKKMKRKGMKLVLDWIPNHSSDRHIWFQYSLNRQQPYSDFYVWADGAGLDAKGMPKTPNNWQSVFGGSAWQWNSRRGQFYLHQFMSHQPDLNYHNPALLRMMKEVLQFWLDLGVDGFYLNSVAHLVEDAELRDNMPNISRTFNLPETLDVLSQFRSVVDGSSTEEPKVLVAEDRLPASALAHYYGNTTRPLAHLALSTEFVSCLKENVTAQKMYEALHEWMSHVPNGAWPHWMMGNQDEQRIASRLGPELADAITMLMMLLPGTPLTYYGDELGMEDVIMEMQPRKEVREVFLSNQRNQERSPMQWADEPQAGFTTSNETWLPVNKNYKTVNVQTEEQASWSHIKVYQALVEARHSEAVMAGTLNMEVLRTNVLAYTRIKKGSPGFLVAVNFAPTSVTVDLTVMNYVPNKSSVYAYSTNFADSNYKIRNRISNEAITFPSKGGIVLTFVPDFPVEESGSSH